MSYDLDALISNMETTPKFQGYKLDITAKDGTNNIVIDVSLDITELLDDKYHIIWRWEGVELDDYFIKQLTCIVNKLNPLTYKSHYTADPGCIMYSGFFNVQQLTMEYFTNLKILFRNTTLRVIKERYSDYHVQEQGEL
jgi:hypothetical protein